MKLTKFILRLLWRHAARDVETAATISRATSVVAFQLPAAPPTGRRVKSARNGQVFRRMESGQIPPFENDRELERILLQWGQWKRESDGSFWGWAAVLSVHGPVALMPNDEDPEEARLYGPVGQRWGDPNKPCPYDSCCLGMFHTGPHEFTSGVVADARLMDFPPPLSGAVREDPDPCTCGRPAAHLPICARYARISGAPKPSLDA